MTSTLRRYLVLQVPGVLVAAVVASLLWTSSAVSGWVALAAFAAWVVKDIVLYPFVKSAYETTVSSGADRLIGETATAATILQPNGRVRVRGEFWNARLQDGGRVDAGCRVVVVASDGLTLVVSASGPSPMTDA